MSVEKLRDRLEHAVSHEGLKNMHVSWGADAGKLTPDERAAVVLEMMDSSNEWAAKTDEEKMRIQIKQSYESLSKVIDLCKTDLSKDFDIEDAKIRSSIFGGIEQAMLLLGNWIGHDDLRNIRAARSEAAS